MAETIEMTETKQYKLREVRIRLEEGRALFSDQPMSNPEAALDVMRREGIDLSGVSVSQRTRRGCQKAPQRFLPRERSTAVLPPTEESTAASRVVGICT